MVYHDLTVFIENNKIIKNKLTVKIREFSFFPKLKKNPEVLGTEMM